MLRHNVLFCMFWTKTFFAMFLCLSMLFWFSWRIYDLHSRASPPALPNALKSQTLFNPDGTVVASCIYKDQQYARLEPQVSQQLLLGFSLEWAYDTPTTIMNKLNGYKPAVFNTFMEFNLKLPGLFDASSLNWFGSEAGRIGAMLEITMQPTSDLNQYTTDNLDTLSKACAAVNSKYGVPILMRFGHEMNGPWTSYAFDPTNYKPFFRNMTESMRRFTNMTAMVWGPNVGFGYPFGSSGGKALPTQGDPNFALLDTNNDNVIDSKDDPYGPYYPGDDWVDWVAVSLYFYPPDYPEVNHAPNPDYFNSYLTGSGYNQENDDASWLQNHNFYQRFAQKKPMMLPETGAPILRNQTSTGFVDGGYPGDTATVSEITIKQLWWSQLFSATTLARFPNFKLAVNFEEMKFLNDFTRDWRLTNDTAVRASFVKQLSQFPQNQQASAFTYGCDGSVKLS
ncbi:glycoside hydrolase superfamily [Chytriomyces sp. MP71]|nr:glycoside hydrolase superfamily [Chytriomyces sp. MP71]